jgi:hypothetical protein
MGLDLELPLVLALAPVLAPALARESATLELRDSCCSSSRREESFSRGVLGREVLARGVLGRREAIQLVR